MRTLVKVLLFVFWLVGAGTGLSIQGSDPADHADTYYYTVTEGVDLALDGERVALHIESELVLGRVSLAAAVPSWVAALPHHMAHRSAAASGIALPENESIARPPSTP